MKEPARAIHKDLCFNRVFIQNVKNHTWFFQNDP